MKKGNAIEIYNLSKQYKLGLVGTGTISHDLKRWWHMVRGKEDPYLKIGDTNDRSVKGESEYVWALKDINFEVTQGEVLGIIGKNGAGKSTLLKLLSRVTGPTTGKIAYRGRIGALLEVGTGFHPELTGRENIFLNGAILGMTRQEILLKFDDIVDFSGCGKYIDTPVKRYSSGMTVRLGFAVAAFLEPEILVVDEVLAVGDAEFQKRAIGKMQDVSRYDGRTVLFVSHNMTAIENLCRRVYVLDRGKVGFSGSTEEGIRYYLNSNQDLIQEDIRTQIENLPKSEDFQLIDFRMYQEDITNDFLAAKAISVDFEYKLKKNLNGIRIGYDILDASSGTIIFRTFHDENENKIAEMKKGLYTSKSKIPANIMKPGNYVLKISIGLHNVKWYVYNQINFKFGIINIRGVNKNYADVRPGVITPYIHWETE